MKKVFLTISCVLFASTMAFGHWYEGDTHKMHYPQMPDPFGWDINMTNFVLADDWKCTQSGPVEDIHFWYSVEYDHGDVPPPHFQIFNVSIHDDVPAGVDAAFSHPGTLLWQRGFTVTASMINGPWDGDQGWDDPTPNSFCREFDHTLYWQLNLTNIDQPFIQEEGEVYWLDLRVVPVGVSQMVGWKTTEDPYRDAAVYQNAASPVGWSQIRVCTENRPTDLAFVITPEPATMILLGMGSFALLRRRRA